MRSNFFNELQSSFTDSGVYWNILHCSYYWSHSYRLANLCNVLFPSACHSYLMSAKMFALFVTDVKWNLSYLITKLAIFSMNRTNVAYMCKQNAWMEYQYDSHGFTSQTIDKGEHLAWDHYRKATWASRCLHLSTNRMFVQQIVGVDFKRRNTLGCLDQHMVPDSKYTGGESPPPQSR